jgi:diguanylate cyclase (GGDEF)-like protein
VEVSLSPLATEQGTLVSAAIRDCTERRRFEGELQYLADHDALTGLLNRRRFASELTRELRRAERFGMSGAVMAIDLDHFKFVNDKVGHARGDRLITETGEIFSRRLRKTDVLARIGGDEFGVILPGVRPEQARLVAASLLHALGREARIDGPAGSRRVSASIGIAPFSRPSGLTGEELMIQADIAMYDAKESGRNRFAFYNPTDRRHEEMHQRLTWADRIRAAIAERRFVLHAQPIIALGGDSPPRHELLVRMVDDDGKLIPPTTFLYVAERFDLVQEIDQWVLGEAVRLLAEHNHAGADIRLNVNISARSLLSAERMSLLLGQRLAAAGIDGHGLCLEVTETAAIVNIDRAKRLAKELGELGCELALDDFGSGFASFYYLKHLSFDYLKIDGEFVRGLDDSPTNQLVVQSIVRIAHGLGKRTVAEYVADRASLELLRREGVDYAQGHFIARPAPLEQIDLERPAISYEAS